MSRVRENYAPHAPHVVCMPSVEKGSLSPMQTLVFQRFVFLPLILLLWLAAKASSQTQVGPDVQRALVVKEYMQADGTGLKPPTFFEPWDSMTEVRRGKFGGDILSPQQFLPLFGPRMVETRVDLNTPINAPFGFAPASPLFPDPFELPLRPMRSLERFLYEQGSTMSNIYYSLVLQSVSRTLANQGNIGGVGRLDANFLTVLAQTQGMGTTAIQVLFRQGNVVGQPTNWSAQGASGTWFNMNALNQGNLSTLNIFSFSQGFADDRIVVSAGKMHPNQFFMLNFYANDESRQFMNLAFDGNDVFQPAQGAYCPGVQLQTIPFEDFYINAGIYDIADNQGTAFQNINNGLYWAGAELGWTPNFLGTFSRFNVTFGTSNQGSQAYSNGNFTGTKQTNSMVGCMAQQQIGDGVGLFAEYGLGNSTNASASQELSIGLSLTRPFGRLDDDVGFAYSWAAPTNSYGNLPPTNSPPTVNTMEMFYRLQITNSMQLSPDLQLSFDPASGNGGTVVALGLRLKSQF